MAFKDMLERTKNQALRELIDKTLDVLRSDGWFSDAFSMFPDCFSQYQIEFIRTNEKRCDLEIVFTKLGLVIETEFLFAREKQ